MWRKLLREGPGGWLNLAEAQVWIVWAGLLVRLMPRGRLVSPSREPTPPSPPIGATETVDRLALAVGRVCRHGAVRAECLVRSIALQRMLRAHGIRGAQVCLGIRNRGGELQSHAWVEWGGRVIGDEPRHVRTFTKLDALSISDSVELS